MSIRRAVSLFINHLSSSLYCRRILLLRNVNTQYPHPLFASNHSKRFLCSSSVSDQQQQQTSQQQQTTESNDKTTANNNDIIITERCLKRIDKVLDADELLRVGVRGGGCSGFEYEFSIDNKQNYNPNEDILYANHVVIDRESLEYLLGSKIDYEDELIRSGFCVIDNPLADKSCSCGVSFSLKMDDLFDEFKQKS
ncbi:iron-sulfur cluster insertion protein ErpA [Dermatophagoides pteronyssinus]|uniref:iron-sulfur cluster insertion protein ErpA n=1 Tax=Dermatophagoides pteronyssinus TaxID=6956 RepID=UPI003F66424E